jgi:hypothetical protein
MNNMTTKNLALGATYYNYVGMSKPAVDRQHQGQILLPKDKNITTTKCTTFCIAYSWLFMQLLIDNDYS